MAYDPAGKIAIVTGGASGIGLEVVKLLEKHDVKVACIDIGENQRTPSETYLPLKCNVASEEEVNAAVEQVVQKFGTVDILINNAGVMDHMQGVASTPLSLWHRVLSTNLNGPMHLMRACIPHMLKNPAPHRGSIVNTCSVAAIRGAAAGAAYTSSKAALLALSRNTAWVYRHDGIRCNAVLPGGVPTNIMRNSGMDPSAAGSGGENPFALYHACTPAYCEAEDVAEAIFGLVRAKSTNGAEVAVDRGWSTT